MNSLNIQAVLPLQNESSLPFKICLEPLCEYFLIQPNQKIQIHAVFDKNTKKLNFTLAPNDSFLTVYVPGEIDGFIDCYVLSSDGVRLQPVDE